MIEGSPSIITSSLSFMRINIKEEYFLETMKVLMVVFELFIEIIGCMCMYIGTSKIDLTSCLYFQENFSLGNMNKFFFFFQSKIEIFI